MHFPVKVQHSVDATMAAIAFGVAFATPSFGQEAKKPLVTDLLYAAPSRLVDMDHGRRMNLYCKGAGTPTVILDAGMGDDMSSWALVQPLIATKTRTCSYDRAGLGFSDGAIRPSTVGNIAEDLHALLKAADVSPPYVLVGHSSAGMTIRVFADRYLDEVVGMVSVEGAHEDQSVRGWAIGAPGQKEKWDAYLGDIGACVDHAKKGLVKGTTEYKKCVSEPDPRFGDAINDAQERIASSAQWQAAVHSERRAVFYASADQTRATRKSFGDIPIVVLTHSPYPKNKDETQEEREKRTLLWEAVHTEIAAMSTRGVNMIVPNTGHYIQFDRPQVVVDAVNHVVTLAREMAMERSAPPSR